MKKLLILLLFFGFSFGQESNLVGVWNIVNSQNIYTYVFDKDGSGYLSIKGNDLDTFTHEIMWETRVKKIDKKNFHETGVLVRTVKDTNEKSLWQYLIIPIPTKDDYLVHLQNSGIYKGGPILILWDVGKKISDGENLEFFFVFEGF